MRDSFREVVKRLLDGDELLGEQRGRAGLSREVWSLLDEAERLVGDLVSRVGGLESWWRELESVAKRASVREPTDPLTGALRSLSSRTGGILDRMLSVVSDLDSWVRMFSDAVLK